MARLAVALIALAAIIAAAYLVGRLTEKHHTAADYRTLRGELDAQYAALISIAPTEWEHRIQVAAEHRAKQQEARERMDAYYLDLRSAA